MHWIPTAATAMAVVCCALDMKCLLLSHYIAFDDLESKYDSVVNLLVGRNRHHIVDKIDQLHKKMSPREIRI